MSVPGRFVRSISLHYYYYTIIVIIINIQFARQEYIPIFRAFLS